MREATPKAEKETNTLLRLLEWPSAVALGGLGAFLFSLKQVNPQVRFEINVVSWLVFAAGTFASWWIVHAVLRASKGAKLRFLLFAALLGGSTVASFVYALKDVSPGKRLEILQGAGAAFLFVALALYGFWRLVNFLERQGLPEDPPRPDSTDSDRGGPPPDRSGPES